MQSELTITLLDLYNFYKEYPECCGDVEVQTRFGFKTAELCDITAYDSIVYEIETESGKILKTSPDHLLYTGKNEWCKVKELTLADSLFTVDDLEHIVSIKVLKNREDLYDIQVEDVHEFYANGIVSHNSTILNAICYALYGKPFSNANKSSIVNSINGKNLLVELDLAVNGVDYLIRRGQKPNIFEIYRASVLIPQESSAYAYQDILEKQILKVNIKTLKQTILIGTSSFTPFLELSANDRRTVIENVLGVEILSEMNQLVRNKESVNTSKSNEAETLLDNIKVKVDSEKNQINTIKKLNEESKQNYSNQIRQAEDEIQGLNDSIVSAQKELEKLLPFKDKYNKVRKASVDLKNQLSSINALVKKAQKELDFVNSHEVCPMCNQNISDEHKAEIKAKVDSAVVGHTSEINDLDEKIKRLDDAEIKLENIIKQIAEINERIVSYNTKISYLNRSITSWNSEMNKPPVTLDSIEEHKQLLLSLVDQYKEVKRTREVLANEAQIISDSIALLKDSGIKSSIVSQYLPLINQKINQYLEAMDLFVVFELDSKFNDTIKARGRDIFNFYSLSQGERKRVSIAIFLTWRHIISMRNDFNTNLLFLDEIEDGLDADGSNSVMSLLQNMHNTNIILITHNTAIQDSRVDKFYEVVKENQFSILKES